MEIEQELFQRCKVDFSKLESYGFKNCEAGYLYTKEILNDTFRIDVLVTPDGKVEGKVYDLSFGEEYISYRASQSVGEFVSQVREAFENLLKDIRLHCTIPEYFITPQANRIASLIKEKYQNVSQFLWTKFPGYGVFRNQNNEKWYAVIMNINKQKLGLEDVEIEIVNVKLEEERVSELLARKGFYPAYHMNKENWISIILDGSLSDDEVMTYVEESHRLTEQVSEWVLPANPKYYDIMNCFTSVDTILWKQVKQIKLGDIVYLYVAAPTSAIIYQCKVVEVNLPYEYHDKNITMEKVMKIQLMKQYDENEFTFSKLKKYGIQAIRGPRRITDELCCELHKND